MGTFTDISHIHTHPHKYAYTCTRTCAHHTARKKIKGAKSYMSRAGNEDGRTWVNEITKVISRNIELERKKSVNRSPLYKHLSLETPVPLVTRLRRDIDSVLVVESAILVFNVYHADPAAEVRGESQQNPKLSVVPSSTCPRFGQSEGEITTANTVLPKGCPDTMKTVLRLIVSNNLVLRAGRLINSLS